MTNDKLPEEITDKINIETESYEKYSSHLAGHIGYRAGATAWAQWKLKYDEAKADFERVQKSAIHYANRKDEVEKQRDLYKDQAQLLADALRGCIGTIIFWYEVLSQTEGFGVMEAEYLEAKNQSIKRIETALQQFKDGTKGKNWQGEKGHFRAVWPLYIVDKVTGERHEVNKIVYHPENEPEPHVWCDTWYGHHVIGKDCEWAGQESPAAGREEELWEAFENELYEIYRREGLANAASKAHSQVYLLKVKFKQKEK